MMNQHECKEFKYCLFFSAANITNAKLNRKITDAAFGELFYKYFF